MSTRTERSTKGYTVRVELLSARFIEEGENVWLSLQVGREYKWSPAIQSDKSDMKGKEHKWKNQKFMITIEDPAIDKIKLQCWSKGWFSASQLGEGALACAELPRYAAPISVKVSLSFRGAYSGEVEIGIAPAATTTTTTGMSSSYSLPPTYPATQTEPPQYASHGYNVPSEKPTKPVAPTTELPLEPVYSQPMAYPPTLLPNYAPPGYGVPQLQPQVNMMPYTLPAYAMPPGAGFVPGQGYVQMPAGQGFVPTMSGQGFVPTMSGQGFVPAMAGGQGFVASYPAPGMYGVSIPTQATADAFSFYPTEPSFNK